MFFVLEEKLIQKLIRKLNYVYIIKNGKSNFKLIEKIIQKIVEMLNINIDQNIKLYFNNGSKKITTLILIIFFQ